MDIRSARYGNHRHRRGASVIDPAANPFASELIDAASLGENPYQGALKGTLGKMENELGEVMDILSAPNPDYGDLDDDLGFVEG